MKQASQSAAADRHLAGHSGGSGHRTRSCPLARPYGPCAGGAILFAASQAVQMSATPAADRALPVALAERDRSGI
jgi:hypothetical protein